MYVTMTGIIPCNRNSITLQQPAPVSGQSALRMDAQKDSEGRCPTCKRLKPCPDCFQVCSMTANVVIYLKSFNIKTTVATLT